MAMMVFAATVAGLLGGYRAPYGLHLTAGCCLGIFAICSVVMTRLRQRIAVSRVVQEILLGSPFVAMAMFLAIAWIQEDSWCRSSSTNQQISRFNKMITNVKQSPYSEEDKLLLQKAIITDKMCAIRYAESGDVSELHGRGDLTR